LGGGNPATVPEEQGGFVSHPERVEGHKVRERSPSFTDHFSQATLFWNSLTEPEKEHLVQAAHFELGKVMNQAVKERMLGLFNQVDRDLVKRIAVGLGMPVPAESTATNHGQSSPALSIEKMPKDSIQSRKVAILAADGVNGAELMAVRQALKSAGAHPLIVSKMGGTIKSADGKSIPVEQTFLTTASVLFDAVYLPGGKQSIATLKTQGDAVHFINEAFKHCKPIAASGEGVELLMQAELRNIDLSKAKSQLQSEQGVIATQDNQKMNAFADALIQAMIGHRYWERAKELVAA